MRRTRLIFIAIFCSFLQQIIFAQNMYVQHTNGNTNSYPVNAIKTITFSGNNMNINQTNSTTVFDLLSGVRKITFNGLTGINNTSEPVGKIFTMLKTYPNPFISVATIEYELPESSKVEIVIFDINGKRIKNIADETQLSGKYKFTWDGKDNSGNTMSCGIYSCQVQYNNQTLSNKMIFTK